MKKLYYVLSDDGNDLEVVYVGYDREQARDALETELEHIRDPRYGLSDNIAYCEVYDVPDDTPEWNDLDVDGQIKILEGCETFDGGFEINEMWSILDEIDDENYGLIEYSDDRKIFGKGYTAEDLYHDSDIATYGGVDVRRKNGDIFYQTFYYKDSDGREHMVTARRLGPATYPKER